MIKLKDILLEIGDASARKYQWTRHDVGYKETPPYYRFKSASGLSYQVFFSGGYGQYDVSFHTVDPETGHDNPSAEDTHANEQYQIMATVVDIIKDFKLNSPTPIELLDILPDKTDHDSEGFDNNRRYRMYAAYIEKLRWDIGDIRDVHYEDDSIEIRFDLDMVIRDRIKHGTSNEADLVDENFADGKRKGKSKPGRVKRSGASCKGSVTSLRRKAKKYGGERGKMYHWCANMKAGKKK